MGMKVGHSSASKARNIWTGMIQRFICKTFMIMSRGFRNLLLRAGSGHQFNFGEELELNPKSLV